MAPPDLGGGEAVKVMGVGYLHVVVRQRSKLTVCINKQVLNVLTEDVSYV